MGTYMFSVDVWKMLLPPTEDGAAIASSLLELSKEFWLGKYNELKCDELCVIDSTRLTSVEDEYEVTQFSVGSVVHALGNPGMLPSVVRELSAEMQDELRVILDSIEENGS
jgi:hypothetical protein